MHDRFSPRALLLIALVLPIAGCTNSVVDSLAVTPTIQSLSVGQTVQLTATGTTGHGSNHPSTTSDVTDSATWTSSTPAVASVNSTGLATALTAGTTTITANDKRLHGNHYRERGCDGDGIVRARAAPAARWSRWPSSPVRSRWQIPSETTQFLAIGTTSTGATVNLTSQVAWSTSSTQIATVGASTGLATALTAGHVTVVALYTSGGSTLTGTASFTVSQGSTEQYTVGNDRSKRRVSFSLWTNGAVDCTGHAGKHRP